MKETSKQCAGLVTSKSQLMTTRKEAWRLVHKHDKRIKRCKILARNGHKGAALKFIQLLMNQDEDLKAHGWFFVANNGKRQIKEI